MSLCKKDNSQCEVYYSACSLPSTAAPNPESDPRTPSTITRRNDR